MARGVVGRSVSPNEWFAGCSSPVFLHLPLPPTMFYAPLSLSPSLPPFPPPSQSVLSPQHAVRARGVVRASAPHSPVRPHPHRQLPRVHLLPWLQLAAGHPGGQPQPAGESSHHTQRCTPLFRTSVVSESQAEYRILVRQFDAGEPEGRDWTCFSNHLLR